MFETIIYLVLLIILIISILFSTIVIVESKIKQLKSLIKTMKKSKKRNRTFKKSIRIEKLILSAIYINTPKKAFTVLTILSFLTILLLSKLPLDLSNNSTFSLFLKYTLTIIPLYAIGKFIHHSTNDIFIDSGLYLLKLLMLLIYILAFLEVFLEDLNNFKWLLLILIVSIGYSFAFIKYVIDSFPSFLFQFINFMLALIITNFIVIGTTFGFFYLNNFEYFPYFSESDYKSVMQNDSLENLYFVAYKGITPFFIFPNEIDYSKDIFTYIPVLEHLIGYIFNLLIVGFFVSYSVSKLIERKSLRDTNK